MDPHPDSPAGPNPHWELIARVVAWHNRQPLARRITADQVRGIGVVALPFMAAAGALHPAGGAAVEPTWDAKPDAAADPPAHAPAEASTAADATDADLSLPERAAARLQADDGEPAAATAVGVDATASVAEPASAATTDSQPEPGSPALPPVAHAAAPAPSRLAKLARWWPLRRATANVGQAALAPAFNEDFIAPIKPRQVARFARRHGSTERPGDSAEPQRDVLADGAPRPVVLLYLRSAAIEVGDRRLRVLVGVGPEPAVIGPRLWSRPRVGSAAALGLTCLLAGAAALWLPGRLAAGDGAVEMALHAGPAASAASAASAAAAAPSSASVAVAVAPASEQPHAPAPLNAPVAQAVAGSAPAAATAPAGLASPAPTIGPAAGVAVVASASAPASAPGGAADVAEAQAAALKPELRPQLTAEQREAARREGEALRATSPARKGAAQAVVGAAAGPTGDGHNYALVTRTTRGRAASEVMLSLMVSAAAGSPWPGQPRTEVMQVPQGWRAVWWPFGSLGDAEGARAALAQYGINAEIVEF